MNNNLNNISSENLAIEVKNSENYNNKPEVLTIPESMENLSENEKLDSYKNLLLQTTVALTEEALDKIKDLKPDKQAFYNCYQYLEEKVLPILTKFESKALTENSDTLLGNIKGKVSHEIISTIHCREDVDYDKYTALLLAELELEMSKVFKTT